MGSSKKTRTVAGTDAEDRLIALKHFKKLWDGEVTLEEVRRRSLSALWVNHKLVSFNRWNKGVCPKFYTPAGSFLTYEEAEGISRSILNKRQGPDVDKVEGSGDNR